MIHPTNHLERIKIKYNKDEKRKSLEQRDKEGRVRRKRIKEEVKARETYDELQQARDFFE